MANRENIEQLCALAAPTLKAEAAPIFAALVDSVIAKSSVMDDIDIAASAMRVEEHYVLTALNRAYLHAQREATAMALVEAQKGSGT